MPRNIAAMRSNIQHNPDSVCRALVFDIDIKHGFSHWYDCNAPEPNFIILNPDNGHAHYVYMLAAPVPTTDRAKRKPLAFLSRIERGLLHKLSADLGYAGYISKNPLSERWKTHIGRENSYPLDELAQWVQLDLPKQKKRDHTGLGRNCILFDELRYWAYARVNEARLTMTFERWVELVTNQGNRFNTFSTPLPIAEVKATAKSVSKWSWTNYTGSGKRRGRDSSINHLLSDREKQQLSAIKTNEQRKSETERRILAAVKNLQACGHKVTQKAVAESAKLGIATVKRYKQLIP